MRSDATVLAAFPTRVGDLLELTKPRITTRVVVTAAVGYAVGSRGFDPAAFVALLLGTAMVAGGASALNQHAERDLDARMERTRHRPLPAGRLTVGAPADLVLCALGNEIALLATINVLTPILGAVALTSYVLLYTPLSG